MGTILLAAVGAALIFAAGRLGREVGAVQGRLDLPGAAHDGGWSQSHDEGRLYVQKKLGSAKVQTTYKENVFSNASVPQVVAGLVRDGYKMIFGTSFRMFEAGNGQLYRKYPDVLFEQATGLQIKKNQSEYFGAGEDTIYLSGIAAGAASKKGLIGYVVPFGIPRWCATSTRSPSARSWRIPKAKVKLIWTNSWYSPPKETAAAQGLISAGVDVLGQNVDSPAAGVVVEKAGVPWVGYDSNAQRPHRSSG